VSFIFLSIEQVLRLHQRLIETSGGSLGIRDRGVLESGLAAAENRFLYEGADLAICAATYAYHLTKAHAFIDGNKRVGAAAAEAFLRLNSARLTATNEEALDILLAVAAGECTREEVEVFFREKTQTQ
jgi:death on curing protein